MLEEEFKADIVNKMKSVGTYNEAYTHTIDALARILSDYLETIKVFEETGKRMVIKHTNKNGSTNLIKNPIYLAIEKLRDDILSYSRELGLTPAGLKRLNSDLMEKKPASKLEEALMAYAKKK